LEHGAEINAKTNDGLCPLLVASLKGHADIVKLLLENHADVDIQTDQGATALMIAAANGHEDVVTLLLEKGANISLKNEEGKSADDVAATEEIRILLKNILKNFNVAQLCWIIYGTFF
jgi:serine/threonine-protein phosphatase 6 regulatory ankyrin repeat subunit B